MPTLRKRDRLGGAPKAVRTNPVLDRLRDAFYGEIERQHLKCREPKSINYFDALTPPSEGREDIFAVFEAEIRMTPIIVAVLKELRQLPEDRIPAAIDVVLKDAAYY